MPVARTLTIAVATLGIALGVGATALARNDEPVVANTDPITIEPLTGFSDYSDDVSVKFKRKLDGGNREVIDMADPGRLFVARITVQPGAKFPWHTHPGPAVVSVVSGELIYQQASDCVERSYVEDDSFLDTGQNVHIAWNPTEDVTELIATFHGAPDGGPVTIPESDQSDRCA
jgi:hypothetical protein